ncbi:MAG: succinylglutamate desuccinylase/aspartoacylase family protein [Gammaproteobacteria bacterium]|nr:succinylglutamate desuccinylase/aspartoacylase family protein [Gammaproteobacteria bacterium]
MTSSSDTIFINEIPVELGDRRIITIDMPKLYDCTPITMPIHVIRGEKPGPVLCVVAAIHGDEINGIEVIKLLLKKPQLKSIVGTLIAVPIVNIYGFLYQTRYLMDRRDLNRSFPGSFSGSLAARLAHLVMSEVITQATHIVDLHTGSLHRSNYPQIRANLTDKNTQKIAKAFNSPVILHSEGPQGSLRFAAEEKNIPIIVYEAGEALRFNDTAIKIGIKGVLNVMQELKMIRSAEKKPKNHSLVAQASYWVRSPHSGITRPFKTLGDIVKEGELLATISNPVGDEEYHVIAPHAGMIIGKSNIPTVHDGAALFHIATFEKLKHIDDEIINRQISLDPNLDASEMAHGQPL